ncbi:LysR family transcriptional regulator (plasmid) [Burkholderia sp. YI23]|uniref:LysR family transcriptional regulator n=2 Tax=Caballeronia TaxID=1827195 RepID=UPI0002388117|nr:MULTISPECIES: LysR family transcriptional regulator [unclassified Caballeronia]AET94852.1 LysR family transcriptional regulator [Burkholderia sp. YI23]MCE4546009.1 LysR family transcriptional regulator [Caballeronia sp. PC1]MCE4571869.1 LysR family transcriptional regulator [Caballeronia sp. CLC5]
MNTNLVDAMRVFLKVADARSFRGVARELGFSNALVTRAIALLERHLGVRLLNRTTRAVSLTVSGVRYIEGCRAFLQHLDRLETAVVALDDAPGGTVRVVASSSVSALSLTQLIDDFHKLHPTIEVRLTLAGRRADFDGNAHDVGILIGKPEGPELEGHVLGVLASLAVATPAFLIRHDAPMAPVDLQDLPCICLQDEMREEVWTFRHATGAVADVRLAPAFSVSDAELARLATLAGVGFAILPRALARSDIEAGRLVRLLPAFSVDEPHTELFIVRPARRHLLRETRLFADYAEAHLRNECEPTGEALADREPEFDSEVATATRGAG